MRRKDTTEAIIDAVLRLALGGGVLAVGILAPNAISALDKPLRHQFDRLDKKAQEREARRVITYMKSQGLLTGEYDHGLIITDKGRERLAELDERKLHIDAPKTWDHTWRIVLYDIPEARLAGRKMLAAKLRELGFFQLQRSAWVHPFDCREVVEKIAMTYAIEKYVSYIEAQHIDNDKVLIERFKRHTPEVTY